MPGTGPEIGEEEKISREDGKNGVRGQGPGVRGQGRKKGVDEQDPFFFFLGP